MYLYKIVYKLKFIYTVAHTYNPNIQEVEGIRAL